MNIPNEVKSHFLRLYQMALSDDDFSPLELKLLYQFAEQRNIPKEELDKILTTHCAPLTVPEDLDTKIEYLYDLALMVWADGVVDPDEMNSLRKYCKKFGFLDENIDPLCNYLLEQAKNKTPLSEIIKELKA